MPGVGTQVSSWISQRSVLERVGEVSEQGHGAKPGCHGHFRKAAYGNNDLYQKRQRRWSPGNGKKGLSYDIDMSEQ